MRMSRFAVDGQRGDHTVNLGQCNATSFAALSALTQTLEQSSRDGAAILECLIRSSTSFRKE